MQNTFPKKSQDISCEVYSDLCKSLEETKSLASRQVRCPYCDFFLTTVYTDTVGHLQVKCQKCKRVSVLNLAYFRRTPQKQIYSPRIKYIR